jgi:hypothetical protein
MGVCMAVSAFATLFAGSDRCEERNDLLASGGVMARSHTALALLAPYD